MNLFQQLTEKPWVAGRGAVIGDDEQRAFFLSREMLGLRVFIAVASVIFLLSVIAYSDRMLVAGWHALPEPWLLWLNTVVLISSSVAMQWASVSARRGQIEGVRLGLLAGGCFAFAFLLGQLWVWQQLVGLGYFAATNPANAFFYMVTGLHGLHLLGGLVAWVRTGDKLQRGVELARVRLSVELCAFYWHFLLIVWLVLFALLVFT